MKAICEIPLEIVKPIPSRFLQGQGQLKVNVTVEAQLIN